MSGRRVFLSALVGLAALPFAHLARAAPAVTCRWIWTPVGVQRLIVDPSMLAGSMRISEDAVWLPSDREAVEWHQFCEALWEKHGLLPVAT